MNNSNAVSDRSSREANVAEQLIRGVIGRATGQASRECLHNYPHDIYFIGNLRSRLDAAGPSPLPGELLNKLSPCAMGLEVLLATDHEEASAEITLSWSLYYRVFPTFDQQRRHQAAHGQRGDSEDTVVEQTELPDAEMGSQETADIVDRPTDPNESAALDAQVAPRVKRKSKGRSDSLALRFRRIDASATASLLLRPKSSPTWDIDAAALQAEINSELQRCLAQIMDDADHYRAKKDIDEATRVPESALQSPAAFEEFLRSLRVEVRPTWSIEVAANGRRSADSQEDVVFALDVTNASAVSRNPNLEFYIFDVAIGLRISECQPKPFRIDLAPRGFRYSRDLWGQGFNCAIERVGPREFRTTHAPILRQARYVTRDEPAARFADLAVDPVPVLRQIESAMREYRQRWGEIRQDYISCDPSWQALHDEEFHRDMHRFDTEIQRFAQGVQLIESDAECRTAFCLTNETFRRLGTAAPPSKRKEKWRLFQIVFIVSQVPALYGLKSPSEDTDAELATVDVVYFPTGGGKTEAYLGTIVYHCFFDRLRGKSAGVTCWTRFPLRLLTLQQTQRMADVIGMAELVRVQNEDPRLSGRGVDPFAVGYFVGSEGTPNVLVPPGGNQEIRATRDAVNWGIAEDVEARQRWKRVVTCPSCQTDSVSVDFDRGAVQLIHRCENSNCAFPGGKLPVYVVDSEIYRYLPSVVVGTVDKLAAVGNQRLFSILLGGAEGRCVRHGYYAGICSQKGCRERSLLRPGVPPGLTGPTLFVQDELHLLKEGLGTFDSHYETFVQRLVDELGQKRPIKIIASSATIEQFERQVEHLYGKDRRQARIFPGLGPRLAESFYARTLEEPQRIFVGVLPHNKTIFNSILELVEYYHIEAADLRREAESAGDREGVERADLYQTSLTYFLANRELNSIRTDLEADTNPRLQENGYLPLQIHELTGSTSTAEVTRTLRKLETALASGEAQDAVLANQMVSHGVDIDRLNAMVFYGMPRSTAEYIQASSRVGRAHVGIVFLCFHSARERDQSHFRYFGKYHEYLGQLVEPVAINRWATYSIARTMPGLFMGVLLQLMAKRLALPNPNSIYMRQVVQQKISTGEITAADFEELLRDAYINIGGGDVASRARFEQQIGLKVRQFIDQIVQPGGSDPFVSSALIPTPMMSLRDVEEAVPIELDSEGSDWLSGQG